ncbi:hypothetical protein F5883DRAFT_511393 [Diaporthe sp. PMI_573]|nr:hypothetical protein F5883DRAFT_511393 [Diaporthaceae sp. PMI_573]
MSQTCQRIIIESSSAPIWYNLAATAAQWIVLAGFFILLGTSTSLKGQSQIIGGSQVARAVIKIPLIPLAGICYAAGVAGLAMLWSKFKSNYMWLLTHLFWQSWHLNCTSGLITIILNMYTARDGTWSPTAWVTLGIVLFSLSNSIVISLLYRLWLARLA